MAKSIQGIYMVEASKELRETQKKLLCESSASFTTSEMGDHSVVKYGATPISWPETLKSIPIGTFPVFP